MSKQFGDTGEKKAAEFLRKQGYRILTKNFRTRRGEVDIIARDGETLVFVEVKSRQGETFGKPVWAVDFNKQQHMSFAAMTYLTQRRISERECRFDVVIVQGGTASGRPQFELIKNAFDADLRDD